MTRDQEELLHYIFKQRKKMITNKFFKDTELSDLEYLISENYLTRAFPYNKFFIVYFSEKGEKYCSKHF